MTETSLPNPLKKADFYAPHSVRLGRSQKQAFAGNCLALSPGELWISRAGAESLDAAQCERLGAAGFSIRAVELDEIEKAGGSLRCCIAEIY